MSHCLLSSHSNRGKPEMASTYCTAITCSQHPVTQPDSSDSTQSTAQSERTPPPAVLKTRDAKMQTIVQTTMSVR
jgi:hypothetical protein